MALYESKMVQYMVMREVQKVLDRKRGQTQASGWASSSSAISESSNSATISLTNRTLDMFKSGWVRNTSVAWAWNPFVQASCKFYWMNFSTSGSLMGLAYLRSNILMIEFVRDIFEFARDSSSSSSWIRMPKDCRSEDSSSRFFLWLSTNSSFSCNSVSSSRVFFEAWEKRPEKSETSVTTCNKTRWVNTT